jgi:murein DD-endopeptidase MepM/ murein hydrolase activator NlpD
MQRLRFALLLVLWVGTMLSGCDSPGQFEITPVSASVIPTITATMDKVITPEGTKATGKQPVTTPTPTIEPAIAFPPEINCGETFCQESWSGLLLRPIGPDGKQTIDSTYPYASTKNGTLDPHHGVEFPNGSGTAVLAAQSGEVVFAGTDDLTLLGPYTGFYGNVVVLHHPEIYEGQDLFTLYAHLSLIEVEEGQQVSTGDLIGKVGATGAADGSHLHFEVRLGENDYASTTNPILWFSPLENSPSGVTSTLAGLILDRWGEPLDRFQLSLERMDQEGAVEEHFYPETYYPVGVNGHPALGENFAMADLPAGDYRLAFISGSFYQFNFTLEPGSLGFIKLQLQ